MMCCTESSAGHEEDTLNFNLTGALVTTIATELQGSKQHNSGTILNLRAGQGH